MGVKIGVGIAKAGYGAVREVVKTIFKPKPKTSPTITSVKPNKSDKASKHKVDLAKIPGATANRWKKSKLKSALKKIGKAAAVAGAGYLAMKGLKNRRQKNANVEMGLPKTVLLLVNLLGAFTGPVPLLKGP